MLVMLKNLFVAKPIPDHVHGLVTSHVTSDTANVETDSGRSCNNAHDYWLQMRSHRYYSL